MANVRFFYSIDGTDVHGPVNEDGLRQLFQDRVIGPASHLCREGETTWQPFHPESFRSLVTLPPPPPPAPPPFVPAFIAPPATVPSSSKISWEKDPLPILLDIIAAIVAIGAAILLTILSGARADSAETISYHLGAFAGALFFIAMIPYLVSLPFKGIRRVLIRTIGIVVIAFLAIAGKVAESMSAWRLESSAGAMSAQTKAEARKQIAEKGYYEGNTTQAEANLQKLKEQAGQDNSQAARLVRDAVIVTQTMVGKVKASEAAEKACGSFDPAHLNTLADIDTLRAGITRLRVTQADVLTYFLNYNDHCRAALANGGFSADTVEQFIAAVRKGGHIDQVTAIWRLKVKLSDDHLARLDFLEKNWGSWNSRDGKLLFSDKDSLDAYNVLTGDIQGDVKGIIDLQKQIYR
jgi:hypothetical protein